MPTTYVTINGIEVAVPAHALAYKYADPIEGARWLYDEDSILVVEREDLSLIVRPQSTRMGESHEF